MSLDRVPSLLGYGAIAARAAQGECGANGGE
jgi:hypothetical protein